MYPQTTIRTLAMTLASTLSLAAGCGDDDDTFPPIGGDAGPPGDASSGDGGTREQGLSAAEVAGLLEAADEGEIAMASLAQERASSELVRGLARRILLDHQHRMALQQTFADRIGLTSTSSPEQRELVQMAQTALGALQQASGEAFDRVYLEAQIEGHDFVIRNLASSEVCQATAGDDDDDDDGIFDDLLDEVEERVNGGSGCTRLRPATLPSRERSGWRERRRQRCSVGRRGAGRAHLVHAEPGRHRGAPGGGAGAAEPRPDPTVILRRAPSTNKPNSPRASRTRGGAFAGAAVHPQPPSSSSTAEISIGCSASGANPASSGAGGSASGAPASALPASKAPASTATASGTPASGAGWTINRSSNTVHRSVPRS